MVGKDCGAPAVKRFFIMKKNAVVIGYGGKGAESSIPVQTEKESRERGVKGYTRQMAERVFY